ncbi:tetratricopeptide repeat protein [Marinobacter sp. M1N3S26]|uniref:tetratricopeptide repeat protein n=1 Tax=unclassified Marinobacter TaxID=83889 RepID=UPI00387B3F8F
MDSNVSGKDHALIRDELDKILHSKPFAQAPAVRAFLEFVVTETMAGRGDQINAYTIASEVFDRGAQFDPSSDTIVRTTAGRIRKGLQAYYSDCGQDARVVISLPKGRYVPSFEFRDLPAPPQPDSSSEVSVSRSPRSRPVLLAVACLLAVVATGLSALFWWQSEPESLPTDIVIDVHPVQLLNQEDQALARAIDSRLAPSLSHIGLARITPPAALPGKTAGEPTEKTDNFNNIAFTLQPTLTTGPNPELLWQLIDNETGYLLWAAKERLSGTDSASISRAVNKVSFQVLGEGGAVPLTLDRYHSDTFSKQTCLSRAQLMRAVERASVYPDMRECLERIVTQFPTDASAWAVLSTFYTVRTRYYAFGGPEERAELIRLADHAAANAEEFAPHAYLTKVALMHLALRQRKIEEFDQLQRQIRTRYPGDIYLKLRIASRIARLGRGWEALEIYDEAREDWGINLRSRAAELALAYFVEGEYERAYQEIVRTGSRQRYVLTLKVAIFGKMGMVEEAQPVIDELVENNPDIRETYYPWLAELSWEHPLLLDIADGLARAGLIVNIEETSESPNIVDT